MSEKKALTIEERVAAHLRLYGRLTDYDFAWHVSQAAGDALKLGKARQQSLQHIVETALRMRANGHG